MLEGKDKTNGKTFASGNIERLAGFNYGELRIVGPDDKYETAINAFEVYRRQALDEIAYVKAAGDDVVDRLYRIRNSLAHGKVDVLVADDGEPFSAALRALPIVKLLARMAIDG